MPAAAVSSDKSNMAVLLKNGIAGMGRAQPRTARQTYRILVSGSVQPCQRHLGEFTNEGRTWLGGIASEDHYQTLVDWAQGRR